MPPPGPRYQSHGCSVPLFISHAFIKPAKQTVGLAVLPRVAVQVYRLSLAPTLGNHRARLIFGQEWGEQSRSNYTLLDGQHSGQRRLATSWSASVQRPIIRPTIRPCLPPTRLSTALFVISCRRRTETRLKTGLFVCLIRRAAGFAVASLTIYDACFSSP